MQRQWKRLNLEELEPRNLPSNLINIDATWLQQAGPGPWVLSQANTEYDLQTNVDVPGTAFLIGAPNVTFNLNGHTVIYADSAPLQVTNGGFEQGGSSGIPGWDTTQAPTAALAPAILGMFGKSMLQISNFSTNQTIISAPVSIPLANHEYAASISVSGTGNCQVKLSVIDASTNAVLGSGTSRAPDRGYAAVAIFTPTTTDPVYLQIDLTPAAGTTASMDLDYASIVASRDYGIMATNAWSGDLPAQVLTPQVTSVYRTTSNFTVENGQIIEGQGRDYAGAPLFFNGLNGFTVSHVTISADGEDTSNIDATWASNAVVQNSTFLANVDRISNRMQIQAAINLMNYSGTATIQGNTIVGVPQVGILAAGMSTQQSLSIIGNKISQNAIVSDGYGITLAGVQNFEIANNTITPTDGRGILIDGWGRIATVNGTIHDNFVSIYETPNLEYAASELQATALRIRNYASTFKNIQVYNNSFIATTGVGGAATASGVVVSLYNDQGQENGSNIMIKNNLIKSVVTTADPTYFAQAFVTSGVGAGTGLQANFNVIESNDVSIMLGNQDSWQRSNDDITLLANILKRSSDGAARPYIGIEAGAWENEVSRIRLYNTRVMNGATSAIVNAGPNVSNIQTGGPGGKNRRGKTFA